MVERNQTRKEAPNWRGSVSERLCLIHGTRAARSHTSLHPDCRVITDQRQRGGHNDICQSRVVDATAPGSPSHSQPVALAATIDLTLQESRKAKKGTSAPNPISDLTCSRRSAATAGKRLGLARRVKLYRQKKGDERCHAHTARDFGSLMSFA